MLLKQAFPPGSTGVATSTLISPSKPRMSSNNQQLVLRFVVEAIGATPAVTYMWQASLDGINWYDLVYFTPSSGNPIATPRVLSPALVGDDILYPAASVWRLWAFYRTVVSANTNVTYRSAIFTPD